MSVREVRTSDIRQTLRSFIAEEMLFSGSDYPYPDDASFLENGIVDSMGVMQLVMFIEERFGMPVHDSEIIPDNFDSIERLGAYVQRKRLQS